MCKISVEIHSEFKEDTVILAAFDLAGLHVLRDGLLRAQSTVPSAIPSICGKQEHVISVNRPESKVDVQDDRVTWLLASDKRDEIIAKLDALAAIGRPSHHYVDISGEVSTLILSRDEYI